MSRHQVLAAVAVVMVLGLGGLARALAQEQADPWLDYPGREVERPILPARGGFEMSLSVESISTERAFDDEGRIRDTDDPYRVFSLDFLVGYGITRQWEVMAGVPYLTGEIGDNSGGALGDVYLGSRLGLYLTPALDLALGLSVSIPTGDSDYEYELIGGSLKFQNFRTGDPGYDYFPELIARYRIANWSVRLAAVKVITEEGEVTMSRFGGGHREVDADPGDGYRLQAGAYYQFKDRLVPGLFLNYSSLSETKIDGKGMEDEAELVELQPRLLYQLSPRVDAIAGLGYPLSGKNEPAGIPVLIQIVSRF